MRPSVVLDLKRSAQSDRPLPCGKLRPNASLTVGAVTHKNGLPTRERLLRTWARK